jgi:NAD(P)-dependent dehydrogenase (short-subunit alcohol dehydrogenase family)
VRAQCAAGDQRACGLSTRKNSDIVYGDLRRDIISMKLTPGTAINEKEPTQRSGISRAPVREAVLDAITRREADEAVDFIEDDRDAVMDTNLKSAFFLSQAARQMKECGGGRIVNIASLLSFQGGIRIASYTASKSGLAGLTRLLACEWAPLGINVNAVAPGYVVTNNTEALRNDAARYQAILERIPAGHWAQPSDIAGAVVYLSSDAASYVHGIVLPADGGWLAR